MSGIYNLQEPPLVCFSSETFHNKHQFPSLLLINIFTSEEKCTMEINICVTVLLALCRMRRLHPLDPPASHLTEYSSTRADVLSNLLEKHDIWATEAIVITIATSLYRYVNVLTTPLLWLFLILFLISVFCHCRFLFVCLFCSLSFFFWLNKQIRILYVFSYI